MKKNTLGRKSLELKDVPVVCIENSSSGDRGHHKDDDRQLVFNNIALRVNAALAGLGLA